MAKGSVSPKNRKVLEVHFEQCSPSLELGKRLRLDCVLRGIDPGLVETSYLCVLSLRSTEKF